jgi:hypothetical protein
MVTSGGVGGDLLSGNQSVFSESGAASARSVGASMDYKASLFYGRITVHGCCFAAAPPLQQRLPFFEFSSNIVAAFQPYSNFSGVPFPPSPAASSGSR